MSYRILVLENSPKYPICRNLQNCRKASGQKIVERINDKVFAAVVFFLKSFFSSEISPISSFDQIFKENLSMEKVYLSKTRKNDDYQVFLVSWLDFFSLPREDSFFYNKRIPSQFCLNPWNQRERHIQISMEAFVHSVGCQDHHKNCI